MPYRILTYMLLVIIMAVSGCVVKDGLKATRPAPVSHASAEYTDVFDTWTREARIYEGFETKLIAKATFKSEAYRQAYTDEYTRLYKIKGLEYEKFKTDQQSAAGEYHDFVLAVFVPHKSWDTFSKEETMWKIFITRDNEQQVAPLEIRKLKKKDPVLGYFFPYVTTWKSMYHLRFPTKDPATDMQIIDAQSSGLSLVMTSVIGSAEFNWVLN